MTLPAFNSFALPNIRQAWKTLSLSQKISVISLLLIVLLIPISVLATFNPIKLFQHAAYETPITPPYVTPTPVPPQDIKISFDKSLYLNSYKSYFTIGNPLYLAQEKNYTVEFWFKPSSRLFTTGSCDNGTVLTSLENASTTQEYVIYGCDRGIYSTVRLADQSISTIVGGRQKLASDSSWHFYKFVRQESSTKLFLDGVLVGEKDIGTGGLYSTGNSVWYIGIARLFDPKLPTFENFVSQYYGELDELRISKVARPDNQVPNAPFINDPDTLMLLHFNGNAIDSSSSNFQLYPSGNISYVESSAGLTPTPTTSSLAQYIGGVFKNSAGQGVAGVKVVLCPNGVCNYSAITDTKGFYKFTNFYSSISYAIRVSSVPSGYVLPAQTTNDYRSYLYGCGNKNTPLGTAAYECQFAYAKNDCRDKCDFQVNRPPYITTTSLPVATQSAAYKDGHFGGYDLDLDALDFTVANLPSGLIFNTKTCARTTSGGRSRLACTITGRPLTAGTYPVTISLKDEHAAVTKKTFNLIVKPK